MKIHVLLEYHMNMIGMLAYKSRPDIYEVIRETSTDLGCHVSWLMQGMLNLDMDELNMDDESIRTTHLTLIKKQRRLQFLEMIYTPISSLLMTKKDGKRLVGYQSVAIFIKENQDLHIYPRFIPADA